MDWNGIWEWWYHDKYGNVIQEGRGKNILHDTGQQFFLNSIFAPFGTYATCICQDCSYTTATNTLADVDAANTAFADVEVGDKVYLCGGTDNEATAGLYTVATNADNDTITTTEEVQAGNVAGGIVVLIGRKFAMGLDRRSSLLGTDTAALVSALEEDGTGYARVDLNPMLTSNWTIALDSDYDDYTAASAICTFTATAVTGIDWQSNRNYFIMAHTGTLAAPANEVLIASLSLGDPVTVAASKSITLRYTSRIKETA